MTFRRLSAGLLVVLGSVASSAQAPAPDTLPAVGGAITIVPLAHGTVEFIQGANAILVDPARFGPGSAAPVPPQAPTLILVTDIHDDHLDPPTIATLRTRTTIVVAPQAASSRLPGAVIMANGQTKVIDGMTIEAVAMYNLRPDPQSGEVFHTKGRGNGYVLTIGGKRIYVAGDTSCTPEMRALKNIEVAFLPMNLPYTMSPAEAADCAKAFRPKTVYPYHYAGSDVNVFDAALKDSGIEVRLRDWYPGVPKE
jgi:L-ascorbate metabolism protein UlaG (beta-lactamase superfamily)